MREKSIKRYIPWMLYAENRDLCELYFTVKNKPGMLLEALKVIAKYNINVLSTSGYSPPEWDRAPIILIIDISDLSEDRFMHMLKELEKTIGSKVYFKKNIIRGFLVEELSFPTYVAPGIRALMFSSEVIENMLKGLYEKYGDITATILYNFAFNGGLMFTRIMKKKLKEANRDKFITELMKFPQATGWCKIEIEYLNLEKPEASLRLYDSFECGALKYRRKPSSHLIRGYLSGTFTAITGSEQRFTEVNCIALGDPYCRLVLES